MINDHEPWCEGYLSQKCFFSHLSHSSLQIIVFFFLTKPNYFLFSHGMLWPVVFCCLVGWLFVFLLVGWLGIIAEMCNQGRTKEAGMECNISETPQHVASHIEPLIMKKPCGGPHCAFSPPTSISYPSYTLPSSRHAPSPPLPSSFRCPVIQCSGDV